MPEPDSRHRDTTAFLAPGLLHRLGNVMFTIQGHAELDSDPDVRLATIRGAAERGNRALAVAQALVEQSGQLPMSAAELLTEIGDLLRVPVRERDHAIEVAVGDADDRLVDPGSFCPAVVESVRLVLAAVPRGQAGTIRLELASAPNGVAARVIHIAAAGDLPFPLPLREIARQLGETLGGGPGSPALAIGKSMMELSFGPKGRQADRAAQA